MNYLSPTAATSPQATAIVYTGGNLTLVSVNQLVARYQALTVGGKPAVEFSLRSNGPPEFGPPS